MAKHVNIASSGRRRPPTQGRIGGRIYRELRYYRALLADPRTPKAAKWLIGGGIGYMVLPVDLLPDFIPIIGKLDDLLIAPTLIALGMRLVPAHVKVDDRHRTRRVRSLKADQSEGPVLFQTEALPASFGVRVRVLGHTAEKLGQLAFLLIDLIHQYRLILVTDLRLSNGQFDHYTTRAAASDESPLGNAQTRLNVGFRPLPLITAVMHFRSGADSTVRFVDTEALYMALPPKLKRRIESLRLRWMPHPNMPLDAVLNDDIESARPRDAAHTVTGAQFLNMLIDGNCSIVGLSETCAGNLLAELREHALRGTFCYEHRPSTDEIITWDPRKVLYLAAAGAMCNPRFVYPARVSRTILNH